ncbi:MAG: PAS domain S-box protein [Deltaproteobacteria bacterium]|nr:PAS domain S-box protein [Deltaproteobacteria bacterium]
MKNQQKNKDASDHKNETVSKISEKERQPFCTALSEERYRDFIENINDGVYETDIYGNFVYFNIALCKVFGYPAEDILGANFSKFMDKAHARMAYGAFTKVWVTHQGFTDITWEVIDKSGQTRVIELSAHLILDSEGKKRGFRGIARDVTERHRVMKALKESEERLRKEREASRLAEARAQNMLDFIPYPMVVYTIDGRVVYLNPAFTRVFGWTFEELRGKHIPYVPEDYQKETAEGIERLKKERVASVETQRLTKDGRVLDIMMGVTLYEERGEKGHSGELVILRDITEEKRMARNNDAMLRISLALPAYPILEDLLDYISNEVKNLLNTGGALVILHDKERDELYFQGAAYDDSTAQKHAKNIRFPASKGISGKVIRTGEPIILPDTSKDPDFYPVIDEQMNMKTKDLIMVPLRSREHIIGVLSALNKKKGAFDQTDAELLSTIAGTVALSIESARYSEEIKKAYQEVSGLNRSKDRAINHLSHELKTPVSILLASLDILKKKMTFRHKNEGLASTFDRAKRNLDRILEIQYEVEDIMQNKDYQAYHLLSKLLEQCTDELEALTASEVGEEPIIQRIRDRIEEYFGPKESEMSEIQPDDHVKERIDALKPQFSHRRLQIETHFEAAPSICIPNEVFNKIIDGIIKNAVENTPDGGKIRVSVHGVGGGTQIEIRDFGVGIIEENQDRIFEGFFSTQDTMDYSTKRPFDFGAGGKGADLLRMKIFSERYHFIIEMESSRCRYLVDKTYECPGNIQSCAFCKKEDDCYASGGTKFTLFFPSESKSC